MAQPVLCTPLDMVPTTLGAAYAPADGQLAVATGTGARFGSPSPGAPIRVSVYSAAGAFDPETGLLTDLTKKVVFRCTGRTGDTLTGLSVESGTDQAFAVDDPVAVVDEAAFIADLNAAVGLILNPYQPPAFSAFGVSGQAATVEVGATVAGVQTFTWTTTNSGNVAADSLAVLDVTAGTPLATGLADDGSEPLDVGTVTNATPAVQQWRVTGTDTESGTFSRDFDVTWLWRRYAGTSASATLDAPVVQGLTYGALAAGPTGSYSLSAGGYKYLAWPDDFGGPADVKDAATGLRVAMADASFNAAYDHVDGLFSYALLSLTNGQGVTTDYRVYRTAFVLGGSITILVS